MIVKETLNNCPQCGKECDTAGNLFRPFCCERCKLLDLGNWLSGGYSIAEMEQEEWKGSNAMTGKDPEC
jgi:endogenous inhibitor of DNA gyrase (YacG/DUF329 family)